MLQFPLCWFCSDNSSSLKSPIPLGSTVVLESSLDKKEDKKTFVTCKVTSSNGSKLHTEATGNLFWGAASVWCWQCVSLQSNLHRALLFHTFPAALFVSISVCKILDRVWRARKKESSAMVATAVKVCVRRRCVWGHSGSFLIFQYLFDYFFYFFIKKNYYLF